MNIKNCNLLIKRNRNKFFLSQKDLVEMLGGSVVTISRLEQSTYFPTIKMKKKLTQLGISIQGV